MTKIFSLGTAFACSDIGELFKDGLEYRIAGIVSDRIVERLSAEGIVDKATAAEITVQVMDQTLPKVKSKIEPFLNKAEETMSKACLTASSVEPIVEEINVAS